MQVQSEGRAVQQPSAAEAIVLADIRPIWLPGPEDIVIDHQTGWAYVASQARPPGGPKAIMRLQGAIYGLDLTQDRPQPINITDSVFARDFSHLAESVAVETDAEREPFVRPKGSFHPGGISLFAGEDGSKRLFVVNRRENARTTIEIFEVSKDQLTHLRTVADNDNLISVNDLVAVGPEQFYATNDHGFSSQILQNMELVLHYLPHLHFGSVVYFDGSKFTKVADSLAFPNGITVDPINRDGGWLYVASTWGKKLIAARWNSSEKATPLTFSREIPLECSPDNLEWDVGGTLWIGAHPDFLALGAFMSGMREKSPSWVIRLTNPAGEDPGKAIWKDDGALISSSSVAALYKQADGRKRLLIGAAFDDRMLLGELS